MRKPVIHGRDLSGVPGTPPVIHGRAYRGALLGLAVGDALGAAVEFKAPGSFEPVTDMVGGGPFDLPAGAWTDDTSMALCLADSLIEMEEFDPIDQLTRYCAWWRAGYNSSTGQCFDIGGATRAALSRFERTREPYPGDAAADAAGNAPLVRLAPIPLAYASSPAQAIEYAAFSARTTHGDPRAADAARFFAWLMIAAVCGLGKEQVLGDACHPVIRGMELPVLEGLAPLHPDVEEVAAGSYKHRQPPEIKGSGFVVRSLEAALWALHNTDTWEEGALAAVNLGDDADTTAAIYGQLAGAIYGPESIPERWLEKLVMREWIEKRAHTLFKLTIRHDRRATGGNPDTMEYP